MYGGDTLSLSLMGAAFIAVRLSVVSNLAIALGQVERASVWLISEAAARLVFFVIFVPFLKILGIPLSDAIASMLALFAISFLLTSRCGLLVRDLWLAGWKGFLGSLAVAIIWKCVGNKIELWNALFYHGGFCLLLMLLVSLVVDRDWRNCIFQNLKIFLRKK